MEEHARVSWMEHPGPHEMESALLQRLDLPLNVRDNERNPHYKMLSRLRAEARRVVKDREESGSH
jgi:hypothetical protein